MAVRVLIWCSVRPLNVYDTDEWHEDSEYDDIIEERDDEEQFDLLAI